MNRKSILAVGALLILAAAGAQAETYDGVHPLTHDASRAQVRAEAVVAAHSPDPYADGFDAGVPETISSDIARTMVRQEAVVAAHSPDPYADGFDAGVPMQTVSDISRASVRAQAIATSHSPTLNVWSEAF